MTQEGSQAASRRVLQQLFIPGVQGHNNSTHTSVGALPPHHAPQVSVPPLPPPLPTTTTATTITTIITPPTTTTTHAP